MNGLELGFLNDLDNSNTNILKYADCFCERVKHCGFSYAKPDTKTCELIALPSEEMTNCVALKSCQENCDGIYFDGKVFFHVLCNNLKAIRHRKADNHQYFIQLKEKNLV